MERKRLIQFILSLWLMLPIAGWAVGLGDIQVQSHLNQQFKAFIPVSGLDNAPPASITAGLASEQQFAAIGLTKDINLSNLQFNVEQKQQQVVVKINSVQPISQPVLTFLLQINWTGGQLLREYTVFLDPANYPASVPQTIAPIKTSNQSYRPVAASQLKTYGPTTVQDNLWAIAQQLSSKQGPTPAQMMLTILKLNPQAFTQHNINGLKSGYILTLPTTAQASQISDENAQAVLTRQNQAWQDRTQTTVLPSIAAMDTDDDRDVNSVITLPSVENPLDNAPETVPATNLTSESDSNVAVTDTSSANVQVLENEVIVSNQAMESSEKTNQFLQQELKDLQSQVQFLQQQLKDKSQDIAVLEKMNAEQTSAALPPVPAAASTGGTVSNNALMPWYSWLIMGLLIAVSVVVSLKMPWKNLNFTRVKTWFTNKYKEIPLIDEIADTVSVLINNKPQENIAPAVFETITPVVPTPLTTIEQPPTGTAILDIVDEADVYITYGRYEKAEQLLRSSLLTNPSQIELRLKLLEIYVAQKNKMAFDKEISSLGPLDDLPAVTQTRLAKLLDNWGAADNTASSIVDTTMAPVTITTDVQGKVTKRSPEMGHDRVIEFDGDPGTLYPTSKNILQPETAAPTESLEQATTSLTLSDIDTPSAEEVSMADNSVSEKNNFSQLQTHLDLAKAYMDMGDDVEALAILQEIMLKGDATQTQRAQTLIDEINSKASR